MWEEKISFIFSLFVETSASALSSLKTRVSMFIWDLQPMSWSCSVPHRSGSLWTSCFFHDPASPFSQSASVSPPQTHISSEVFLFAGCEWDWRHLGKGTWTDGEVSAAFMNKAKCGCREVRAAAAMICVLSSIWYRSVFSLKAERKNWTKRKAADKGKSKNLTGRVWECVHTSPVHTTSL